MSGTTDLCWKLYFIKFTLTMPYHFISCEVNFLLFKILPGWQTNFLSNSLFIRHFLWFCILRVFFSNFEFAFCFDLHYYIFQFGEMPFIVLCYIIPHKNLFDIRKQFRYLKLFLNRMSNHLFINFLSLTKWLLYFDLKGKN